MTKEAAAADPAMTSMELLNSQVNWLSAWTIHHANHVRENRDGLKVGGHQASSASLATIMAALYFHILRPEDRVAVKPHASPVFHAIQYLLGNQTREQLEKFRSFGGAQSYPSRTKDGDDVDFSTGSVGLGVAVTGFAALVQDYLAGHDWLPGEKRGRMIGLVGDAEMDEGNVYEAIIEFAKHDVRDTWWIVDYNRQSLDSITPEHMNARFDEIFRAAGWDVVTIKYGKMLEAAQKKPGGKALVKWIDDCPNEVYSALSYEGGAAWRERLLADIGDKKGVADLIAEYTDEQLHALMTDLGGHCLETIIETLTSFEDNMPKLIIAYTVKGKGLPFQGHKDNHAGLMTPTQMEAFREQMGVREGEEWDPFCAIPQNARP